MLDWQYNKQVDILKAYKIYAPLAVGVPKDILDSAAASAKKTYPDMLDWQYNKQVDILKAYKIKAPLAVDPPKDIPGAATEDPKAIRVGDTGPAGGIVFYDKGKFSDGWRFLEVAPASTQATGPWGDGRWKHVGSTASIGAGRANTNSILDTEGWGSIAASYCRELKTGGFKDWFLPSAGELELLYKNLKTVGLGEFKDGWYWSSTHSGGDPNSQSNKAHIRNFSNGEETFYETNTNLWVRAIRAF